MKMLLLAMLVVSTLAHPDYSNTWEEFKEKFDKEYESEEEEVDSSWNYHAWILISSESAVWHLEVKCGPDQGAQQAGFQNNEN